jgi:hypothetical protein
VLLLNLFVAEQLSLPETKSSCLCRLIRLSLKQLSFRQQVEQCSLRVMVEQGILPKCLGHIHTGVCEHVPILSSTYQTIKLHRSITPFGLDR